MVDRALLVKLEAHIKPDHQSLSGHIAVIVKIMIVLKSQVNHTLGELAQRDKASLPCMRILLCLMAKTALKMR